ncbi:unnamed protein product [Dovyalis caffra]|uniref:Uncharacterized protein n=1 Tax=Dovyalis caffra TaxID=77055 RepID=A0AAV1SPV4_9ROSI|nr:unnamed protein product [Dovyalis caffra]
MHQWTQIQVTDDDAGDFLFFMEKEEVNDNAANPLASETHKRKQEDARNRAMAAMIPSFWQLQTERMAESDGYICCRRYMRLALNFGFIRQEEGLVATTRVALAARIRNKSIAAFAYPHRAWF